VISSGKAKKQAARKARLAAALRENLRRRKTQARERAEGSGKANPASNNPSDHSDFRRNRSRD
jgi:hypothetical protein